jgi:hypothetical protein
MHTIASSCLKNPFFWMELVSVQTHLYFIHAKAHPHALARKEPLALAKVL